MIHHLVLAVFVSLSLINCRSLPRYIVTTSPIDVLGVGHAGLCVAVDPSDAKGIWWWEPGRSGCSSRSTGPTEFRGDDATVVVSPSGAIDARFRIQLVSNRLVDVALVLQDGAMQVTQSGQRVPTEQHADIEVPEQLPRR